MNTRRPEFCTVIHSVVGVERAKVPSRAVFRSRRSGTYKVPGAERAKAGRGGEYKKRKNRQWLRARKSTGRRESESVGTIPAQVAGRAKVRAQRERKSPQLFTYHPLTERLTGQRPTALSLSLSLYPQIKEKPPPNGQSPRQTNRGGASAAIGVPTLRCTPTRTRLSPRPFATREREPRFARTGFAGSIEKGRIGRSPPAKFPRYRGETETRS